MPSFYHVAGKKSLLDAVAAHPWRAVLYTSASAVKAAGGYTPDGEVPPGKGYSTGGVLLTGCRTGTATGIDGQEYAWMTFDDPVWPAASFSAAYMLIYDAATGAAHPVIDLGGEKTGQGGNFTYAFLEPSAETALIRL